MPDYTTVPLSTTISPYTRAQIDQLRKEYGTIREVLTLAVHLLADRTAHAKIHMDDYERVTVVASDRTAELCPICHNELPDHHIGCLYNDNVITFDAEHRTLESVGAELWARAGDMAEAARQYGSIDHAANHAAQAVSQVRVFSRDGTEWNPRKLIKLYLRSHLT
jgi:hypothetical protein